MKILQVTYSLGGGVGNVCVNIATQLASLGHEVDVLFAKGEDRINFNFKSSFASKGICFMRVNNPFTTESARMFLKLDENRKYDVVHIHTAAAIFLGMIGRIIENKPLIFHHHGDPPWSIIAAEKERLSLNSIYRDYFLNSFLFHRRKTLMLLSRYIIAVSNFIKDELKLYYRINPLKVMRIYNGVNTDHFRPISSVPRNDDLILFVGRISPVKGLHFLIKAMNYVCQAKPSAELVVVGKGNGSYYQRLLEMIVQLGLKRKVKFLGHITDQDLIRLYNSSYVVVMPSLYEPCPLVALEAFSCGKPVIAFSVGGLKEIVVNGNNGFLVPLGQFNSLGQTIVSLLDQKSLYLEMCRNARESVVKYFKLERQAKQILDMYNSVLAAFR